MSRAGLVYIQEKLAGKIEETDKGSYTFTYDAEYLQLPQNRAVSLTLPLQQMPFESKLLFPFFDGLIPEGWLLDLTASNWKLNPRDRMGLLLEACQDCIGVVSVRKVAAET
jgi:serine/threonine-protein kinase HipA